MTYGTVIFDFDGTLADTEDAMLDALNTLAPEFGFASIERDELPALKALSARELLVSRLHVSLWNIWKIYRLETRGREAFSARSGDIRVVPGIPEVLERLHHAGYRVGIVSSNSETVISAMLERAHISVDFLDAGSRMLGKARAIRNTLKRHSLDPDTVVYVGDELRDVEACRAVGIAMIGVGWGLNGAQALEAAGVRVCATPEAIVQAIQTS